MAGKRWLIISVFLLGMGCTAAAGQIIYVDVGANGLNNGSSWTDAYRYLQDALADANSGDEIWVAQGIYKPDQGVGITPGDRTATFQLKNGVAIRGGYAGFGEPDPNARDIGLYETILSGDLNGNDVDVNDPCDLWNEPTRAENSFHVTTGSGTDETAVLERFTITAGNAYERPWHPMVPDPNNWGGGMYNHFGSPTLLDCTFSRNSAEVAGGGMYNKNDSSPTLTNCTFSENSARSKDSRAGFGGGMYNFGSSPVLSKCTLSDNWAEKNGGGMCNGAASPIVLNCTFSGNSAGWGGGMRNSWGSSPIVTGCLFIGNSASGDGGGMLSSDSSPTVGSCIFIGNSAGERGGGMVNFSHSNLSLSNCVFTGNSATNGGGIYNSYSSMTLTSSTFAGNSATNGSSLACDSFRQRYPSNLELTNCILWNGGDGVWNNDGSAIEISFSDVQGGETGIYDPCDGMVWGLGNIDADPLFADANNGDDHLKSQAGRWEPSSASWVQDAVTSPCIDAGDPLSPIGLEPFPNGGVINMGAYGGTTEASKSYFGEPLCETIVAGDINGDCKVNFLDFRIMALHWLEENIPLSQVPEFYYYSSDRKIYLDIYTAMITVCFEETVTDPEREAVIKQDPILEAIVAEMAHYGVVLVGTKAGSSEIDIIQTIERLEKLPEVRYSTPVFGDSATPLILTDEFIAKFKPDVTEAEIDSFNALNDVEIARKLRWTELYVLRVKDPTNMNTLKTANLYYENPITIYSVPNWIAIGEPL